MVLAVLPDDAFQFALLHHAFTTAEDIADLWPLPSETIPCAAA